MAKVLAELTDRLRKFIEAQSVFFVASAPLSADGHVNLSPKGLDTFRVLGAQRVGYLDLTGSGNETAAHMGENGRITLMFCAFQGPPLILDIHRIQTSCGYAVPLMALAEERDQIIRWAAAKGEDGLAEYRRKKNATSIDGIPAPV